MALGGNIRAEFITEKKIHKEDCCHSGLDPESILYLRCRVEPGMTLDFAMSYLF